MTTATAYNVSTFVRAYVECALWSSTDDNGDPLDDGRDISDVAPESLQAMIADCDDFQQANADDLAATGATDEQNGHDFWLTRNGHGAGFWARGYGPLGDKLSRAAKVYGSVDLYVGDDDLVYQS